MAKKFESTGGQPPLTHAQLYAVQKAQEEKRPFMVVGQSGESFKVINADDFTPRFGYIGTWPIRRERKSNAQTNTNRYRLN